MQFAEIICRAVYLAVNANRQRDTSSTPAIWVKYLIPAEAQAAIYTSFQDNLVCGFKCDVIMGKGAR